MDRENLEQELASAGWEVDGGFAEQLTIGNADDLCILVPQWAWQDGVPLYELYDVEKNVACWVWVMPTPLRAAMLLEAYGEPTPGEWDRTSNTQLRPDPLRHDPGSG